MKHSIFRPITLGIILILWPVSAHASATVAAKRPYRAIENAILLWDPSKQMEHLFIAARFDQVEGPFFWWLPFPTPVEAEIAAKDLTMALPTLLASYRARTTRWEVPSLQDGSPRKDIPFGGNGKLELSVHDVSSSDKATEFLELYERHRDPVLKDYLGRYATHDGHDGHGGHVVVVRALIEEESWTSPWLHFRFPTERPWYPYREPSFAPNSHMIEEADRLLRLTVITTEQVALRHGRSLPTMAYAWLAFEPTYEEVLGAFGHIKDLVPFDLGSRLWLTSFEDRRVIRPGDDDWTFPRLAEVPESGKPGTIEDETGAGLVFDPIGSLRDRKELARHGTGKTETPATSSKGNEPTLLAGKAIRAQNRPALVFGTMVLLALGIAFWASRDPTTSPTTSPTTRSSRSRS